MKKFIVFALFIGLAGTSAMGSLSFDIETISEGTNFIQQIKVNSSHDLLSMQLLVVPSTTGQVVRTMGMTLAYYVEEGVPLNANKSFLCAGYDNLDDCANIEADVPGGAVSLGGGTVATFSTSKIDVAYNHHGITDQIGDGLIVAQVVLKATAFGTWAFRVANANGEVILCTYGTITNGSFLIPEPVTISLLGVGALALLKRRR